MSEIMLNIRDHARAIHGTRHASVFDAILGALAAEPETIEELEAAVARFHRPANSTGAFHGFGDGVCEEPRDAGIAIVDLPARFIACESAGPLLEREGDVQYYDGRAATDVWIPCRVPDDWLLRDNLSSWECHARERRAERAADPPLDARAVLYGEVAGFIARQCLAARDAGAEDPVRDIHARWLMTPRDDLRGRCPRDLLLARRNFTDLDLQWREHQWSMVGECPPTLSPESAAYRFAGFGTHENVIYYEMVRHMVEECWRRVTQGEPTDADAEMERLDGMRQAWLMTPQVEDHGLTPGEIIDRERRRQPLELPGKQAMVDDDCPLCRMLADMPGPGFWHLDGCNMDDDFAFSTHATREEWEAEQRRWEEDARRFHEECERKKAEEAESGIPASVWTRSSSDWASLGQKPVGQELQIALFAVGSHLAEITVDLKGLPDGAGRISALNRAFAELREGLVDKTDWKVRAAVADLTAELEELGKTPALKDRCLDLARKLEEVESWVDE